MRVHVTGARGFVAGHLVAELVDRGHDVTESDLEQALAPELVLAEEPEVVVHAGAIVGRELRGQGPGNAIILNASSSYLLANACAALEVPLVYLSSSEVYGRRQGAELAFETDALLELPHNLYGLTKRWGEEACRLAFEESPELLTVARLSMPYGPGHFPGSGRAALTNFLWAAIHGDPLVVHRDARRSWCWIGDTVRALALLVERRASVEPTFYNVGRDDNERTMLAVAELALELAFESHPEEASRAAIRVVDPPAGYSLSKRLDTDRVRSLGWAPEVELEEGAALTLAWLESIEAARVIRR